MTSAAVVHSIRPARARIVAAIASMLAAMVTTAAAAPSLADRRADFEQLVKTVEEDDVYLSAGGHCWTDVRTRLAARVDAATTDDAWRRVIEDAIDELHDFHAGVSPDSAATRWAVPTSADIWAEWRGERALVIAVRPGSDADRAGVHVGDEVTRIDGVPTLAATQTELHCDAARNDATARRWSLLTLLAGRRGATRAFELRDAAGVTRNVGLPAARRFERPTEPVTLRRLSPDTALIRLNNSLGRQETVAAFDAALASVRDTRGLILDLRDVPSGGNSTVALGILGRFVSERLPYQRHRVPAYGLPDVERNWVEEVAPRGPFTYSGRLVVLVDAWTGSMGEGMGAGLDAMRRATVVGTPMAGLAGSVDQTRLKATGISVQFPTEQLFHVNGTPRHQWRPPVEVAPTPGDDDAVLRRGREVLDAAR